MAAVTFKVATTSTTNGVSYATSAFTPAVGDLLVIGLVASANTFTPTASVSANGITSMTNVVQILEDASADRAAIFVADQLATGTSSMTVSFTTSSATGCNTMVFAVSGMSRRGAAAVKQTNGVDNSFVLGATPTLTFAAAPVPSNPVIAFCANQDNPANVSPPAGFTEDIGADVGYATPNTGLEGVYVNSASPQTVTWGSTSVTRGGVLAVELDASPLPSFVRIINPALTRAATR